MHARRAFLEDGDGEVHAREGRADARYEDRPQPVIDAFAGAVVDPRIGRIHGPAPGAELADQQRNHHQRSARRGEAEAYLIEHRKRHVACAQLLRQHKVDEADEQGHGHEKDHDRPVRAEQLREMIGRDQAAFLLRQRAQRGRLMRAHHEAFYDAARHHDERQRNIHDADLFRVRRGQPVAIKRPPTAPIGQQGHPGDCAEHQHARRTSAHDRAAVHLAQQIAQRRDVPVQIAEDRAGIHAH